MSAVLAAGTPAYTLTVTGCLAFSGGSGFLAWRTGQHRDFVADFLPGLVLTGIGVALVQATLYGLVAGVLPPARFGTGSGMLNMCRQIAIALGVAILVAILGPNGHAHGFHTMFELIVVLDLCGALCALALPTR